MKLFDWVLISQFALVLFFQGASSFANSDQETNYSHHEITISGKTYPYLVYQPQGLSPINGWPVILFLHGFGECGNDLEILKTTGLGQAIAENPKNFPALIVMPQAPLEDEAKLQRLGAEGKYKDIVWNRPDLQDFAVASLEDVLKTHHKQIDLKRIYLTGLSMGGNGVWRLASRHPERFAALLPVAACQKADALTITHLRKIPIWAVHGGQDEVCPLENIHELMNKITKLNRNARLTVDPKADHPKTWIKAYREREIFDWLFSQKRK